MTAVILIIAYTAFDTWIDTHHFKFGLPPWEEDRPAQTWQQNANNGTDETEVTDTNTQVNQAILNYLNQNVQWTKVKLDQDASTNGLYDMINNYRFSDILNVRIDNCDKIDKIKEVSQRMIDNGISLSGSYSQDGTITIQKWIEAVNAKYEQQFIEKGVNDSESDYNQLADEIAKKKAKEEAVKKKAKEEEAVKKKAKEEAAKKKAKEEAAKKKAKEEAAKRNGGL